MLYTISRFGTNGVELKPFSDILTYTSTSINTSKLIFKDGTHWEYPWSLFTLQMLLGYCFATEASKNRNASQDGDLIYTNSYHAALHYRLEDCNLEVILETIIEQTKHGYPCYQGWQELLEREGLL